MTPVTTPATPDGGWLLREQSRYRFIARMLRQADMSACADLCEGWADQVGLEAAALRAVDARMAAIDRR